MIYVASVLDRRFELGFLPAVLALKPSLPIVKGTGFHPVVSTGWRLLALPHF
jgi:hypothetical protein